MGKIIRFEPPKETPATFDPADWRAAIRAGGYYDEDGYFVPVRMVSEEEFWARYDD